MKILSMWKENRLDMYTAALGFVGVSAMAFNQKDWVVGSLALICSGVIAAYARFTKAPTP